MSVASMPPAIASKATLRSPHSVCRLEKPGISIATGRSVLVARMGCSFSLLFRTYSDARWRERGRDPHAALAEDLGDAPTHALEALDREEIVGSTAPSTFLPERSGVGLDVVGPRVAPDTSDPVPDDPRDRGADHGRDRGGE